MHDRLFQKLVRVSVAIALAIVLSLSISGCTTTKLVTPYALNIDQAPVPMTVSQIESDFLADPEKAAAVYAGHTMYFKRVTVDIANRIGNAARSTEDSIVVSKIKFVPRYPADMEGITEGAVLDVIGRVQGYLWGYIVIIDCWINLTTVGGPPPPMY